MAAGAFTLLFYSSLGILSSYVVICIISWHIFIIVVITRFSSDLTAISERVLVKLKKNARDSDPLRLGVLKPMRGIRIYVGNFYFVDPGSLLVILDVVFTNVINVLLAYR